MRAVLIPLAVLVVLVAARMVALNVDRSTEEQAVSAAIETPGAAQTAGSIRGLGVCPSAVVDPVGPVGHVRPVRSDLSPQVDSPATGSMTIDEDFSWTSPVDDVEPVPSEAETWAAWEPPPGACTQPEPSILPASAGQLAPSVAAEKTGS